MSWLPRLSLTPCRGRLQFVKDAPAIGVRDARPEIIDTRRVGELADAISSLRQELSGARENA
jgi:hypothetical protein